MASAVDTEPSCVQAHVSRVVQKLGVADRREAVAFFYEASNG